MTEHEHNPIEQPDGSGLCECGQVFEKLGETTLSDRVIGSGWFFHKVRKP